MFESIRRFLIQNDPTLREAKVSENLHKPLTQPEIDQWIVSLNPVEIRVDDEGNPQPEDVRNLKERINNEVARIWEKESE